MIWTSSKAMRDGWPNYPCSLPRLRCPAWLTLQNYEVFKHMKDFIYASWMSKQSALPDERQSITTN